jgi:hypothetical protein
VTLFIAVILTMRVFRLGYLRSKPRVDTSSFRVKIRMKKRMNVEKERKNKK